MTTTANNPDARHALATILRSADGIAGHLWADFILLHRAHRASSEAAHALSERAVDAAEEAILETPMATIPGAMVKLVVALLHSDSAQWVEDAIIAEDFGALIEREADLDFPARLIVGALVALVAQ